MGSKARAAALGAIAIAEGLGQQRPEAFEFLSARD